MGITDGNPIVFYDSATVKVADNVLSNSVNITKNVNYNNPVSPVNGNKNDSLYAHFTYASDHFLKNKQQNYSKKAIDNDTRKKDKSEHEAKSVNGIKEGPLSSSLKYAFISDLRNLVYPTASSKDTGGVLIANSIYSNSASGVFARRELNSVVILPLFGDSNKISNFKIKWQSDFQMKYLGMATVEYTGFDINELSLYSAYHITSSTSTNIASNLTDLDSNYAIVTNSGIIKMKFDASGLPNLSSGHKREFVIEVNGHYVAGSGSMNANVNKTQEQTQVPLTYSLSQNYPNPFNPVTKINYSIAKDNKVKLVIYDILGREVITLLNNEFKQAGRYSVNFDGTNFASGVYFYRIEAGNFVQSKKMLLIK